MEIHVKQGKSVENNLLIKLTVTKKNLVSYRDYNTKFSDRTIGLPETSIGIE